MNNRTQCTKIHSLLKSGPVTNLTIFRMCGSMRGSARIFDLRERGVDIETTMIKKGDARIAEYSLAGWEPTCADRGELL